MTPHPNGQWSKKHRGKQFYFGSWDDWEVALDEFNHDWPQILKTGERTLGDTRDDTQPEQPTIGELCDRFIDSKRTRLDCDELSLRSFREYQESTKRIIGFFGRDRTLASLMPADFDKFRVKLSCGPKGKRSPVSLGKYIRLARMVFKFADDDDLIERRIRFGQNFEQPSKRTLRLDRQSRDKRMFEADEILQLLKAANPVMRAMILFGINCGFGNTDLANLPQSAIDLGTGWIDYPLPKTGVERRVPLWPETIEAIREAVKVRPKPKDVRDDGLCLLTRIGKRWVRHTDSGAWLDSVGGEFKKLMKTLNINRRRNFYALRHSHETIAGESTDQVAVNSIMGHADASMSAAYRERISDERLQAVVETVREWLEPEKVLSDGDVAAQTA